MGDIIILEGPLGGGKTTFIKGVLKGMGFKGRVLSPSYTLARQYNTKNVCVNHLDLYRLEEEDFFDAGIDDLLCSKKSMTLIEWGDKIKYSLSRYINLKFSFLKEDCRQLVFSTKGYNKEKVDSIEKAFKNGFK